MSHTKNVAWKPGHLLCVGLHSQVDWSEGYIRAKIIEARLDGKTRLARRLTDYLQVVKIVDEAIAWNMVVDK